MSDTNQHKLWSLAQDELAKSLKEKGHPFRLAAMSTFGTYPELRYLVNRHIDHELNFYFYTDSRSPKVTEILNNDKASILFYDANLQLQVRIKGQLKVINDGPLYHKHKLLITKYPKDYTTLLTPGHAVESEIAFSDKINFALLRFEPTLWDILKLGTERHYRYRYQKENDSWIGGQLVP